MFNELQAQMVANISENYLFDTIDPPYVPIEKSSPVRSAISVFGTLFGFILSIIYVLTRQFFINKKF
jgi:LPS O-antigen subunit length determinant protein (WzzB/FepE family)